MLWALFSFALIVALVISMQPMSTDKVTGNAKTGQVGRRAAMAALIVIPALAVAIYMQFGASGTTQGSGTGSLATGLALPDAQPQAQTQLPDVDTMVQRLADRLKRNPSDLKGWKMLGWSYSHLDRPADAVAAYRHAVDLAPTEPELHALYAEALVQVAGNKVTTEAYKAIGEALAINPDEPRARYLSGLWQEQQGHSSEAFDAWNKLLKSSDINADWVPELKTRLEKLAVKLGKDPAPYKTAAPTPTPAVAMPTFGDAAGAPQNPHIAPGPTPEDVAAARAMSPESQAQMVNGMVERLVAKLQQDPKNLDGWLMLARSRMVQGDPNAARTAIGKAKEIFAGDATAQSRISDYAKDIGLTP